jgi:phosphatidylinositol glycan class U
MGPGPDLESPTKREKQLTRCPRSGNVSWLLKPCVVLILFLRRYLLNPYIFLPSLALSTSSFENTLLLISLMFACQGTITSSPHLKYQSAQYFLSGKSSASLLVMSLLIHLSLSNIIMLSPLFLLLISDPFSHLASPRALTANLRKLIPHAVEFVVYSLILTLVSTVITGSWAWIPQTWGATYVFQILFMSSIFWTH